MRWYAATVEPDARCRGHGSLVLARASKQSVLLPLGRGSTCLRTNVTTTLTSGETGKRVADLCIGRPCVNSAT